MSRQPVSVEDRAETAELKQELLRRFGLPADASDRDIESAHNVLAEFLELAPHKVNSWAAAQSADVDQAFALLSGPEQLLVSAGQGASRVQPQPDETPEGPGTAPVTAVASAATAARKPRRAQLMWAIAPPLIIAGVFLVFQMGNSSTAPDASATPTAQQATAPSGAPSTVPVDKTKVEALMKTISTNPKDTASLLALGDIYFAAADYKNAAAWEQKALDVDPKNQAALLAIGASQFNVGNTAEAKKHWLTAVALDPKSAKAHYDLGFLYLSQTPPDKVNMTAEWNKVIAIDPASELAKAVATHLNASAPTPTAR
ncbi:MAG: tetratricopeptide repeat protein [Actinomycetota bacterium]